MPDNIVNLNVAPYNDDYDPSKGYTKVVALPGRVEQAREFTQIQTMFMDFLKRLGDTITKNGTIQDGCGITIQGTNVTISSGKIYYNGIVYNVPTSTVTITGSGKEIIGVVLNQSVITETTDSSLRDPASGYDNYNQPGAYRVQSQLQFVVNDATAAPVYTLNNGQLQIAPPADNLSVITDLLARRTYDTDGNFAISGLTLSTAVKDANNLTLSVAAGKAYIKGYEVTIPAVTSVTLPKSQVTRTVLSEPKVYNAGLVDPGSSPLSLTTDSATTSSLTNTTYYVSYDFTNGYGRTKKASNASILVGTVGKDITTSVQIPAGGTGVGIYVGTTTSPLLLGTISSTGTITYSGTATSGLAATVSGSTINITISAAASATGAASVANNTTAQLSYSLNNNPVKQIDQVTATVQLSQSMTRGGVGGGIDYLPNTPVVSIVSVVQGGTTYVQGTDFQLTSNGVDWSLPGAEPSSGSTYNVTYQYMDTMTAGTDYALTSTGSGDSTLYYVSFTGTGALPVGGSSIYVNYDFYLARKDLIQMDQSGNIVVTQGQSDLTRLVAAPVATNTDLLQLGTVQLNPNSTTTTVNSYAITRMSQGDLQRIFQRVQSLEYNQALSSLDNQAMQGQNPTTLKGILTDAFVGTTKADLTHSAFSVAFAFDEGAIYLPFLGFTPSQPLIDTGNSSATVYGRLATAPVTETLFVSQPYATDTMLANPYQVYTKQGKLNLTPAVDNWVDVTNVVVEQNKTALYNIHRWWYHGGTYYNNTEKMLAQNLQLNPGQSWSGSSSQITGTLTSSTSQTVLDSAIFYMRQSTVKISVSNLAPNADNLALTFAGIAANLTPVAPTVAGTTVGTVKADANGTATATFTVPVNIPCGTVPVVLSNGTSSAQNSYTAFGRKRTVEDIVTKTKVTVLPTDPLAESFMFTDTDHIVTSVGLYFSAKDSTAGVKVQLRDMINGFPGQNIYAETVLTPSQVNTSANGTIETKVTFTNPVLCKVNTQYCFVIETDSPNYSMWVGTLGKQDVATSALVSSQPYVAGTLFSSANALTWTPSQSQDLKFNIYVGTYPSSGTVQFQPITGLNADALLMMADYLTPTNTGCTWQYQLNSGSWQPMANFANQDLSSAANSVTLKATFNSSNYMSPLLATDSFTLIAFQTATSGSYVSKNVNLTQGFTTVTMTFNANIPSGCTVTPQFATDTSGTSWTTPTLSTTQQIDQTYTQYTYTYTLGASATNFRARLNISAPNALSRPSVKALMNIMK